MNYKVTYSNKYLSHHGILGQKWGKRNGPPYPLDAGDHSASEKKAGWKESLKTTKGNVDSPKIKDLKEEREVYVKKALAANSEYQKLDKEADELEDEIARICSKYDLDGDDFGGGDYDTWSEEEIRKASEKCEALQEKLEPIWDRQSAISKEYRKAGEQFVAEKYGDMNLKKMKAAETASTVASVAVAGSLFVGYIAAWATHPIITLAAHAALPVAVVGAAATVNAVQNAKNRKAK